MELTDQVMFNGDELATNVWKSKYAQEGETHYDQMHKRLAKEFARIERNYQITEPFKNSNLETHKDRIEKLSKYGRIRKNLDEETIYNLFKDFKYIVPQGSIMSQLGSKSIGSLSNCFVIGTPEDSYGGIFQKDEQMAQLMKRRGGVGLDISTLRPKDTLVSNAAKTTTGAISFMHRFSNTTNEVAQNGRRGALMLSIDINHPDVMDFIKIKRDKTSVTGANISIKINDEFMKAVENDEDYLLRFPCTNTNKELDVIFKWEDTETPYNELVKLKHLDGNTNMSPIYVKKIKAKEYWNEIIKSAHGYAEPGIIFVDNHHNYSPDGAYPQFKGVTTNPSLRHNTLIQTDLGLFPIKHLAEKDGLTIVKNVLNEWQVGKVFMSGKDKDLYKITFTNGYEVFCTAEHKWVILNSTKNIFNQNSGKVLKKRTDELMFGHPKLGGDRIPVPFKPDYEGNVSCTLTNDEGFLAGYYLGDGHKSQCSDGRWQYGFIVSEKELECCGERLLRIINTNKSVNTLSNWNQDHDSKSLSTYVSQRGFVDYCEALTLEQDKSLGIPKNVWTAGAKYIKGFIDGLFSSDGSVWDNKDLVHSRITLTTSREKIALDVQKLLNLFGVISRVYHSKNEDGFNRWDLTISGIQARKFAQTFKLTSSYKQEKLNNILSFENTYKDNREYLVVKSVENTGIKEDVYDITVHDDTHTFMGEFGVTGNCGEIFMQPYDACRLIALNLYSFVKKPFTKDAEFDSDKFYRITYEAMRLSDDLIDLELKHIDRIIEKISKDATETSRTELELWLNIRSTAEASRRTGLGFTALGDCLAALGYKYDSEEALLFVEQMMHIKMEAELDCTIDLAILRGPFKGWDPKVENTYSERGGLPSCGENSFYQFVWDNFFDQAKRMEQYGRRNVSWSTVAPTGTVSLLTQTTSGIEPVFKAFYTRRKKVTSDSERVDFIDDLGIKWQEFPVLHHKFKDWVSTRTDYIEQVEAGIISSVEELNKATIESLFKQSPWYGSEADNINWTKRVELQSIVQKYTTHSISSTINLPNDVSVEEVSNIYFEAWKQGLKGITVYRDGSRDGVLISSETNKSRDEFNYVDAVKRPKQLDAEVHMTKVGGVPHYVIVGLLNNKPYEIFIENKELPIGKGTLIKQSKGNYKFVKEGFEKLVTSEMSDEQAAITRLTSTSLRHGTDIKFLVEQLNKCDGDLFSFTKGLARTLKKYIPDGVKSTVSCQDCGSTNVIFEEGCNKCLDCGSSACS